MEKLLLCCTLLTIFTVCSCQTLSDYNDTLIETSLACEIPTLIGNCIGGVVGIPFLLISTPVAYFQDDTEDTISEPVTPPHSKTNTILWPMKITSQAGGALLGTPFYPLGLILPRENFESTKKTKTTPAVKN